MTADSALWQRPLLEVVRDAKHHGPLAEGLHVVAGPPRGVAGDDDCGPETDRGRQ